MEPDQRRLAAFSQTGQCRLPDASRCADSDCGNLALCAAVCLGISMGLVTAAERRQGLARWLLRYCVEDLVRRALLPVLAATRPAEPFTWD